MNRFRRQTIIGLLFLAIATALTLAAHRRFSEALPKYAYLTGWIFLAVMILLAAYNGRKKLPFLPLGTSEAWLQIHIYAGFFTVVLFLVHVKFRMPTGWFEGTLAWLYLLVTLSGVAGLLFSRVFPRRLATRGGEVIYEKIPALRHRLRSEAEALVCGPHGKSVALAEFYTQRLHDFFSRPRNFRLHLLESRRPLNIILSDIEELRRYLNQEECATLEKLAELVRQKDGLDYHFALQSTLKLWLFVHLPLTYSLMLFTLVHLALVFAFSGGAR